jgi:hypothetical protein
MNNPLIKKLETVGGLSDEDKDALHELSQDVREVADRHSKWTTAS